MFTKTLSTKFSAKFSAIAIPAAALLIAFAPGVASADMGGPVMVIAPNASVVAGVEVAGALSSGAVFSCVFTDGDASVQTCQLPAGTGSSTPSDSSVAVAGIRVDALGAVSYSCVFDAEASGPQTCAISN